jgi:hypothetical protein
MGYAMNDDEIRRLLSEYAAGSISEADCRILFKEALTNQSVFESMAAEQPLADLMSDAAARSELRAVLAQKEYGGLLAWLRRPWAIAATATASVALLAVVVSRNIYRPALIPESRIATEKQAALPRTPAPPSALEKGDSATTAESRNALPAQEAALPAFKAKRAVPPTNAPAPGEPVLTAQLADDRQNKMTALPPENAVRREPSAAAPTAPPAQGAAGKISGGALARLGPSGEAPKSAGEESARTAFAGRPSSMERDGSHTAAGPQIRYQLQRRDQGGGFEPVPEGTVFRPGEVVRLRLEPETSGYLAVAERSDDGAWRILFPEKGDRAIRVEGLSPLLLPPGGLWEFSSSSREHRLLVIFTRDPQIALLTQGGIRRPETGTLLEIILRTAP